MQDVKAQRRRGAEEVMEIQSVEQMDAIGRKEDRTHAPASGCRSRAFVAEGTLAVPHTAAGHARLAGLLQQGRL